MTTQPFSTDRDPGDETDEARCPDFFGGLWVRCELARHHEGHHRSIVFDKVPLTWSRIRPGSSTVDELLETAR